MANGFKGFEFEGKHYSGKAGLSGDDIGGIIEIRDHTKEVLSNLNEAIATALEMIGLQAERYAKEQIRINKSIITGRLRNSITHTTDIKDVYIGTNVEYAPFVEFGTSKRKAKPFLRPAAQDHMPEYISIMRDCLGD